MIKRKNKLVKGSVIPFVLIIIIACLVCMGGAVKGDIETEVVFPGIKSSVPVIAVDNQNNPHVISYQHDNGDLIYAYRNGGSWQNETVDSEGDVGDGHGLAVDQNGNPHVSYRDKTNGSLKYAKKEGGSWQTEVLDPVSAESESSESSSIAIDSNGNPCVAYNIQSLNNPKYIKYARWDGSSWNIEDTGINGHWVSLGLDSDNNPHIAFHVESTSRVYYTRRLSEGSWSAAEDVDPQTSVNTDPHIVIDSNNYSHILYRGNTDNGSIRLASYNGSSWDVQTVVSNVGAVEGSGSLESLAIDANERPCISYCNTGTEGEMLATADQEGWTSERVDSGGVCYLAVDGMNRKHVAYTHGTDTGEIIKYALVSVEPLEIDVGDLQAGESFSFTITLSQAINESFDYYIIAETPFGLYTLYLNGGVQQGIKALYTSVPGYNPTVVTVTPNASIPATMGNREITFYTAAVQAGYLPPVSSLSELTSETQYVIMLDKNTETVEE